MSDIDYRTGQKKAKYFLQIPGIKKSCLLRQNENGRRILKLYMANKLII